MFPGIPERDFVYIDDVTNVNLFSKFSNIKSFVNFSFICF